MKVGKKKIVGLSNAPLQQEELVNADKEASIEILCQNGGSSNQNGVPSNIITNPPSEVGKHQGIRECKKTTQRSSCHANKVSQVLHWTFIPMERNSAFWSTRNRKDHACKGCCNGVQHNIF